MNSALLLCAASIVLPLAAWEVRRKWRDYHRQPNLHGNLPKVDPASVLNGHPVRTLRANPSVEGIEAGKDGNGGILLLTPRDGVDREWIATRIAEHQFLSGPVWAGVDVASGDEWCGGHGGNGYAADTSDAPGKCGENTPSFGMTGGTEQ